MSPSERGQRSWTHPSFYTASPHFLLHFINLLATRCTLKIQTSKQTATKTKKTVTSDVLTAKCGSCYTLYLCVLQCYRSVCFFLAIPLSVFQNSCLGTKQTQEKTSKKCLLFQRRKIKQNEPNFLNWGGDAAILAANSLEYSSDP